VCETQFRIVSHPVIVILLSSLVALFDCPIRFPSLFSEGAKNREGLCVPDFPIFAVTEDFEAEAKPADTLGSGTK
jgi:hypothetical protein